MIFLNLGSADEASQGRTNSKSVHVKGARYNGIAGRTAEANEKIYNGDSSQILHTEKSSG